MSTQKGDGMSWYDMTDEQQKALPEKIRDYDWCEAFGYSPVPIGDVAEVIASADGENDGDNWVGVFKLRARVEHVL